MLFTHDTEFSLGAAVELVNSAGPPDTMTTLDQLDEWYRAHSYTGRRDHDLAELDELRALRPGLHALLTSERDDAAALVNALLADAGAVPQLVRHEPFDWHLHAVPADASLACRVAVETAMAMLDVVRADETSRLGVCADDGCSGVVLDLSRNRSRRYCSTACGNRQAVAAYRARRSRAG
jgi:predicted RNA-binding Zn ribbon-like protein